MTQRIVVALFSCAMALSAADFQDYQAARAVIGQASFSGHDKGVMAVALSLSKGNLYVADNAGRVLSFDLSRIGESVTAGCPVCLTSPQSSAPLNVFEGIGAVAVNGHNVAIADAKSHRVMIWSDNNSAQPGVVLTGLVNPTSVALDNQRLFVGDAGSHHVFIWNQLPVTGSQPPDVTLGVSENYDVPSAGTIQTPSALVSDGVNLFVGDAAAHRVLVFSAADTSAPEPVNAATLTEGPFAPGTLISVEHASGTASVFLNGTALRVTDVSGDQLQFQIPFELNNATSGSLWIQSEWENGAVSLSRAAAVHFTVASPGIFGFGLTEPRTGLVLHAPAGIPLSEENPAKPSELLTAWATGLGNVSSVANRDGSFDVLMPVRATVNGIPVEVASAVLPSEATGIYEVRLRLPAELSGAVSLILSQNDSKSNAVTFPVKQTLP